MSWRPHIRRLARRIVGREPLAVWHDGAYRLPVPSLEARLQIDPRRADLALWALVDAGVVSEQSARSPRPVSVAALHRVHDAAYLQSLTEPERLARILGIADPALAVDAVLNGFRTACGGTVEAARHAIATRAPALNLLGGFHHAYPEKGGGLCPYNDVAIAVAVLRDEGFAEPIVVLDLDAHPPDGTAACLRDDDAVWIGSISGSDWGPLPDVDETVLPTGTDDATYLRTLDALLERMPAAGLAFVIAGGDVLDGDRYGLLGLSLAGTRERDRRVAEALSGVPSVWLPAGGYSAAGWRVLAGTGLVLAGAADWPLPDDYDPLGTHFARVSRRIRPEGGRPETGRTEPDEEPWFTEEDVASILGPAASGPRLFGLYSGQWLEHALYAYGVLPHFERLGYRDFRVRTDQTEVGERIRVEGTACGQTWLLVECQLDTVRHDGRRLLFVNWLTLRHPLGAFSRTQPRLPGQEVPGPGLAREAGELLARVAIRLRLDGVAFRPSSYHVAWTARYRFVFADPERQRRFEALVRDLGDRPLRDVSRAIAEGRVCLDGEPYTWEPDLMVQWLRAPEPAAPSGPDPVFTLCDELVDEVEAP